MSIISFEKFSEIAIGDLPVGIPMDKLDVAYSVLCATADAFEEKVPGYIEEYCSEENFLKYKDLSMEEQMTLSFKLLKESGMTVEDIVQLFVQIQVLASQITGEPTLPYLDDKEFLTELFEGLVNQGIIPLGKE